MVLYFCSNAFGSFIFVANFIVFWAICSFFSSSLQFRASFSLANKNLTLTSALLGLNDVPVSLWISAFVGSGRFWVAFF